jgi:uncharacterized small protein (DUF1192 family)
MAEAGQIVTYYPAAEEFGPHPEDNTPRAALVVEAHKGKGLAEGLVTLKISGPVAGRGPFKTRAYVPPTPPPKKDAEGNPVVARRGTYDTSKAFEKVQGKLERDAFADLEEQRPPTPTELARMVARQNAEIEELKAQLAAQQDARQKAAKPEGGKAEGEKK